MRSAGKDKTVGKPILCLDFDGVLHSYTSGWKGATIIPDDPVPGAPESLVGYLDHFQVTVFSSRSHQWGGRRAMKGWLRNHLMALGDPLGMGANYCPDWWRSKIAETAFADPWEDEVAWAVKKIIKAIDWPTTKPAAMISIDDRAIQFTGIWPSVESLKVFRPWNKQ